MEASERFRFRRRQRLSGRRAFAAVFEARCRRAVGPMLVFVRGNGLAHSRLGLSVSRRVGKAVRRNRIKRLVREAFRLQQHELPGGYDVVVVVRPHEPAALADYARMLRKGFEGAVVQWHKRRRAADEPPNEPRNKPGHEPEADKAGGG